MFKPPSFRAEVPHQPGSNKSKPPRTRRASITAWRQKSNFGVPPSAVPWTIQRIHYWIDHGVHGIWLGISNGWHMEPIISHPIGVCLLMGYVSLSCIIFLGKKTRISGFSCFVAWKWSTNSLAIFDHGESDSSSGRSYRDGHKYGSKDRALLASRVPFFHWANLGKTNGHHFDPTTLTGGINHILTHNGFAGKWGTPKSGGFWPHLPHG